MTASVFTQYPEARAGQQIARHSSYTSDPGLQSKVKGNFRAFFQIASPQRLTSSGESQSELEPRVASRWIERVLRAEEAQGHEWPDVLDETRQPLYAG